MQQTQSPWISLLTVNSSQGNTMIWPIHCPGIVVYHLTNFQLFFLTNSWTDATKLKDIKATRRDYLEIARKTQQPEKHKTSKIDHDANGISKIGNNVNEQSWCQYALKWSEAKIFLEALIILWSARQSAPLWTALFPRPFKTVTKRIHGSTETSCLWNFCINSSRAIRRNNRKHSQWVWSDHCIMGKQNTKKRWRTSSQSQSSFACVHVSTWQFHPMIWEKKLLQINNFHFFSNKAKEPQLTSGMCLAVSVSITIVE